MTSREADGCSPHSPKGWADVDQLLASQLFAKGDAEAVEEQLPGGDGGKRQGGGLGKGERAGLGSGEALIDQMEFAVGAGTEDGAGVEDFVAGLEESDVGADGLDDAGAIEAENLGLLRGSLSAHADLGVDGIDRNGADGDEQVARAGGGRGEFEVEEGIGIGRRQGLDVANGFHDGSWMTPAGRRLRAGQCSAKGRFQSFAGLKVSRIKAGTRARARTPA